MNDYEIKVKPTKLTNHNSDIWSLGIIILEVFLSLYIHKKDCREMVHNLYLNKLTYSSRCIIINEIIGQDKNPVICSLIKEMLRDEQPNPDCGSLDDVEPTIYQDLLQRNQKS